MTVELARNGLDGVIEITEREMLGEDVMSQIVGHVLLREHGDENHHSILLSTIRGILVGQVAAEQASRDGGEPSDQDA